MLASKRICTSSCFGLSDISLVSLLVLATGCGNVQNAMFTGTATRIPQSQAIDYAPPIKMQIDKCYWTNSVNIAEDLAQTSGVALPEMRIKAQDSFLVVEVSMTNHGTTPLIATESPLFELKSSTGTVYQADTRVHGMTEISAQGSNMGHNINPGRSIKGRLVFDVPKGTYDLIVYKGEWQGSALFKSYIAGTWGLSPE